MAKPKVRIITGQAQNIAYQVNQVADQLADAIAGKLPKNGLEPMEGNLDMNNNAIVNISMLNLKHTKLIIKDGEEDTEPASYRQLKQEKAERVNSDNYLYTLLTGEVPKDCTLPVMNAKEYIELIKSADGVNSGLDADKVDGVDSAYLLNPQHHFFDNSATGMKATNIKDALNELYFKLLKRIEEDISPKLGGVLDANGHSIVFTEVLNTSKEKTIIDWNKSNTQALFLTRNTEVVFINPIKQANLTLRIIQDDKGNHNAILPVMKTTYGSEINISKGKNAEDLLFLYFDGKQYIANVLNDIKLQEKQTGISLEPEEEAEAGSMAGEVEVKFPFYDRWVFKFEDSAHLNTEDDKGTAFNFGKTPFTIEMWINPSKTTGNGVLVSKIGDSGEGYSFEINNSLLLFKIVNETGDYSRASTEMVERNEWSHVAVVRDGDLLRFYINGKMTNEYDGAKYYSASSEWSLQLGIETRKGGEWSDSSRYRPYEGMMAEVAFWGKALAEEEIKPRLESELKGDENDLIAYYKLDKVLLDEKNTENTEALLKKIEASENQGALEHMYVKDYSINRSEATLMAIRKMGEFVFIEAKNNLEEE